MKQVSKQIVKFISILLFITTACSVYAGGNITDNISIGTEVGTLGVGANIDWKASDNFSVGAGYTTGNFELKDMVEKYGLDFDVNAKFKTPYVGMQYRPMNNWFTLNAGVAYIGDNKFSALSTPKNNTKFTVDGEEYIARTDARIDVDVNFKNKMIPYLTVGAKKDINKQFSLVAEIGAGYTGGYTKEIDLDGSYGNSELIDSANYDPTQELTEEEFNELAVKIEEQVADELAGKVKISKMYPIVKVGLIFRF